MIILELTGQEIIDRLDDLAGLRLNIFREYPYLYEGKIEDERCYLADYAAKGCALLACDGERVAGAITGMPLADESAAFVKPFFAAGLVPEDYFYIGELLLHKQYRGQGLGSRLLANLEQLVGKQGRYHRYCFATVVRPDEHHLRPLEFIPIERFSIRHGYRPLSGVSVQIAWQELDGQTTAKTLRFWDKETSRMVHGDTWNPDV